MEGFRFPLAHDLGMAGGDLLDQGRARTGYADDVFRLVRVIASAVDFLELAGVVNGDDGVHPPVEIVGIETKPLAGQHGFPEFVSGLEIGEGGLEIDLLVVNFPEREMKLGPVNA